MINGYGKDKHKPSYVSSRSFRNAILEITGLLDATSDPSQDPLPVEAIRTQVQQEIDAITNENLRRALNTIWVSTSRDVTEFRAGLERGSTGVWNGSRVGTSVAPRSSCS